MSILKEFQDKELGKFLHSKENGLVLFSAPWCAACKIVTPVLEKIAQNMTNFQFIKVDVSKSPGLAARLGVMSLPNILIVNRGKIVDQLIGTATKQQIEEKLKKTGP